MKILLFKEEEARHSSQRPRKLHRVSFLGLLGHGTLPEPISNLAVRVTVTMLAVIQSACSVIGTRHTLSLHHTSPTMQVLGILLMTKQCLRSHLKKMK
jgi:hypothetical protein